MSTVALAVMVYKLTGSVLQMGGIMAASAVPLVLTAWVGGAFLDRYSARNVMVVSDLVRAALIFSMPFLAGRAVGFVYVVAALMGIFSGVFNPGQIKLVGEMVEPSATWCKANSYLGVSRDGPELAGYLVGGVVASISQPHHPGRADHRLHPGLHHRRHQLRGVGPAAGGAAAGRRCARGRGPGWAPSWPESPAVLGKLWRAPALRTNLLLAVFAVGRGDDERPQLLRPRAGRVRARVAGPGDAGGVRGGGAHPGGRDRQPDAGFRGDKNGYVFLSLVAMAVCYVAVGFSGLFWLSVSLMGLAGIANVGVVVPSITMFQEIPPDRRKRDG